MENSISKELIELYVQISKCRVCKLPANCRPQLRPPGPGYKKGGIVFVQINPGYLGAMDKKDIRKEYISVNNRKIAENKVLLTKKMMEIQDRFLKTPSIENFKLLVDHFHESRNSWGWPAGKFKTTVEDHGVELKDVAIINLAQCPVEKNRYGKILKPCFEKWFFEIIGSLKPVAIVTQSKVVHNFFKNVDLPKEIKLIEGVHHADRRSNDVKQSILKNVKKEIAKLK